MKEARSNDSIIGRSGKVKLWERKSGQQCQGLGVRVKKGLQRARGDFLGWFLDCGCSYMTLSVGQKS